MTRDGVDAPDAFAGWSGRRRRGGVPPGRFGLRFLLRQLTPPTCKLVKTFLHEDLRRPSGSQNTRALGRAPPPTPDAPHPRRPLAMPPRRPLYQVIFQGFVGES